MSNEQMPLIQIASLGRKKLEKHELRYPKFRFIVGMDWLDKIGEDSFGLYLRLFTMADRSDSERDMDKLPTSISSLVKRLGISRNTFYRRVRSLYEYGLIDYKEYEDSKQLGQKPVNIVIFEAPWNDEENMKKPLVKLRSWDDRIKEQFPDSYKGGRKKNTKEEGDSTPSTPVHETKQGGVLEKEQGAVPQSEHNNYLNNINNSLNPINNSLNVNNLVNNGESEIVSEEVEKQLRKEFRDKAEDFAYKNHYSTFRTKHKMSKDGFLFLVGKIIQEKIDSGKVSEVYDIEAWIAGALRNVENHRTYLLRVEELQQRLNSYGNKDESVEMPEEVPNENQDVPSDEELLDILNKLKQS